MPEATDIEQLKQEAADSIVAAISYLNINQKEASEIAKVNDAAMSRICTGQIDGTTLQYLIEVAGRLGVTFELTPFLAKPSFSNAFGQYMDAISAHIPEGSDVYMEPASVGEMRFLAEFTDVIDEL